MKILKIAKIINKIWDRSISKKEANKELLILSHVSDKRELLISFMEFRDEIYWGENEYTENEEIIDLWLKRNK